MPEPPEALRRAVASFNRHRSPEVTAEIASFDNNELHVRFRGAILCHTCGLTDYFEDIIFELDPSSTISLTLIDFKEEKDSYLARYRVTYRQPSCHR